MKNENISAGDANIGNVHEQCCMSDEQAKIALAIIKQPDQRFASLGENECNIAQSDAMFKFVRECATNGTTSFADHFDAHVKLIKRNAHEDRMRKMTVRTTNKKTGAIEYSQRFTHDEADEDANVGNGVANRVAQTCTGPESIEEHERSQQINELFSAVISYVSSGMVLGELPKKCFALYLTGMSYYDIGIAVYGRAGEKKQVTNRVSAALHFISTGLRTKFGDEAKRILRPVGHISERFV